MRIYQSPLRLVRQSDTRPWHIIVADLGGKGDWYRTLCNRTVRGETTGEIPEDARICPSCDKKASGK